MTASPEGRCRGRAIRLGIFKSARSSAMAWREPRATLTRFLRDIHSSKTRCREYVHARVRECTASFMSSSANGWAAQFSSRSASSLVVRRVPLPCRRLRSRTHVIGKRRRQLHDSPPWLCPQANSICANSARFEDKRTAAKCFLGSGVKGLHIVSPLRLARAGFVPNEPASRALRSGAQRRARAAIVAVPPGPSRGPQRELAGCGRLLEALERAVPIGFPPLTRETLRTRHRQRRIALVSIDSAVPPASLQSLVEESIQTPTRLAVPANSAWFPPDETRPRTIEPYDGILRLSSRISEQSTRDRLPQALGRSEKCRLQPLRRTPIPCVTRQAGRGLLALRAESPGESSPMPRMIEALFQSRC